MRLVVDPDRADDGKIMAVLDVDLEPGWKTYWRDPGSAGIPPMLDFSQSAAYAISRPFALSAAGRVDDGYAVWAGYTAPVRFPADLSRTAIGRRSNPCLRPSSASARRSASRFRPSWSLTCRGTPSASRCAKSIVDARGAPSGSLRARISSSHGWGRQCDTDAGSRSAALPAFRPAGVNLTCLSPDLPVCLCATRTDTRIRAAPRWRSGSSHLPKATDRIDLRCNRHRRHIWQRAMGQSIRRRPAQAN
jgi:hypothetical protein